VARTKCLIWDAQNDRKLASLLDLTGIARPTSTMRLLENNHRESTDRTMSSTEPARARSYMMRLGGNTLGTKATPEKSFW
jgi:hypothetical protein